MYVHIYTLMIVCMCIFRGYCEAGQFSSFACLVHRHIVICAWPRCRQSNPFVVVVVIVAFDFARRRQMYLLCMHTHIHTYICIFTISKGVCVCVCPRCSYIFLVAEQIEVDKRSWTQFGFSLKHAMTVLQCAMTSKCNCKYHVHTSVHTIFIHINLFICSIT